MAGGGPGRRAAPGQLEGAQGGGRRAAPGSARHHAAEAREAPLPLPDQRMRAQVQQAAVICNDKLVNTPASTAPQPRQRSTSSSLTLPDIKADALERR